jgi:hypothetical protein
LDTNYLYAPVIKGKMNDIKALSYLSSDLTGQVRPIFELPPFLPTDKPEVKFGLFAKRLEKLYSKHPFFVDLPLLKPGARTSENEPVLEVAYGQLNAMGLNFNPVYGFDRDQQLWPTVIAQANKSGGLLLRLDRDDIDSPDETLDGIVELRDRGLKTEWLDLLIDCRYIASQEETSSLVDTVSHFVEKLADTIAVRKIIVAGSSAPKNVSQVEKNGSASIFRNELALWIHLRSSSLPFEFVYSDYGVIHPDFSDLTPATHINGKIRYTQGKFIHIFRGHSLRLDDKYEQYRKLALSVVQFGQYQGNSFSHGDRYIYDCATGHAGTGNPGTWELNDQNHHITLASRQIRHLESLLYRGVTAEAILDRV